MDERFTDPEFQDGDEFERDQRIRPIRFDDMVGQEKAKTNLRIAVEAARHRNEAMDHILLHGPPGLGKTTLAYVIAHELGVEIHVTSGPVLERPADLAGILKGFIFVEKGGKGVDDSGAFLQPAWGQIAANTAEPDVVHHHAGAAEDFEEIEDFLAFAQGVKQGSSKGAQVVDEESDEQAVVDQAGEFSDYDAKVFGPFGNLDFKEFFRAQGIGPIIGHAAQVIQAVCKRHGHRVGDVFGDFLVIAVQVSENRFQIDHGFPVEFQVHSEYTVGGGVVGTHGHLKNIGPQIVFAEVVAAGGHGLDGTHGDCPSNSSRRSLARSITSP